MSARNAGNLIRSQHRSSDRPAGASHVLPLDASRRACLLLAALVDRSDHQAALKVLYLAVRNLEEFRGASVGIRSSGWSKQALQAFTIYFDGRIPTP